MIVSITSPDSFSPWNLSSIDARALHKNFKIGTDFSTWIKRRIENFDAKEGIDYVKKVELAVSKPTTRIEYFISSNFAKEIVRKEQIGYRGETNFFKALVDVLSPMGFTLQRQVCVRGFRLDGFIPELNIVIEYDEEAHCWRRAQDDERQKIIETRLSCNFVRVKEKDPVLHNIGIVMKEILNGFSKKEDLWTTSTLYKKVLMEK